MKGKDKNNRTSLPDLLKYMANKISGKERNSFERELQKDPFANEAAEGFSGIPANQAGKDIDLMKKKLENRVTGRRIMIWYRIAASVAVIMVISSVFFLVNRNKQAYEKPEIALNITPFEIPESIVITKPEKAETEVSEPNKIIESVREKISSVSDKAKGEKARSHMGKDAFTKKSDEMIVIEADTNNLLQEDLVIAAAPAAEADTEKKAIPEPSVTSLDEVAVVGYGVSKRAKAADENAEDTESGYLLPQPVGGKKEFDNYIQKNIKNPVSLPAGKREIVVVSFTVTSTGSIENIKMVKTPGDEYSKESIRLIKDGPAWKSAMKNGIPAAAEVKIKITFKD
jgi:Gram-negative bacterial tonB protein.